MDKIGFNSYEGKLYTVKTSTLAHAI